jgi:hypothetical protein
MISRSLTSRTRRWTRGEPARQDGAVGLAAGAAARRAHTPRTARPTATVVAPMSALCPARAVPERAHL